MIITSEGDNGVLFEETEGRFFVNRGKITVQTGRGREGESSAFLTRESRKGFEINIDWGKFICMGAIGVFVEHNTLCSGGFRDRVS